MTALRAWAAAGAIAFLMLCGSALAATVSLQSALSSVAQGSTFQLRLYIDGFSGSGADSLAGFDLRLNFDPAAVSFQGFDFVDSSSGVNQLDVAELGSFGFLGDAYVDGSNVVAFGLSGNSDAVLDANQANAFDFLRLNFRAEAVGVSALFSIATADPGLLFVDTSASGLPVTFATDWLAIGITSGSGGTVPTPGSAFLTLLALAVLAGSSLARRIRRAPWAAGLLACVALGSGSAAFAAGSPSNPPTATASSGAKPAVQGVVLEVVGQRFKVRGPDGQLRWFTATGLLPERIVNKPVRGVTRVVGDAIALEQLSFE
jgi:hypothetical protein